MDPSFDPSSSHSQAEPSQPPLRFPHWRRLRSGREFSEIYALKQKVADGRLLIFGRNNRLGYTRIGLSVSRKHGNAVARHRLRRLLKEAYRVSQHRLPEGLDLILIPLPSEAHSLDEFQRSLVRLTSRLQDRLRSD